MDLDEEITEARARAFRAGLEASNTASHTALRAALNEMESFVRKKIQECTTDAPPR